jgi:hypothetical protein
VKKQAKRGRVFTAFKLSFNLVPEETGFLYIHLNRTENLKKILCFCDALGRTHFLNLDDLEFVVQKKADLAYAVLDSLMKKGDIEKAKLAIDRLLSLHIKFYREGLHNRDPNFRSNCGFVDAQAIVIDVGRIVYSEEIKNPKIYKEELRKTTAKFRLYLSTNHPELLFHFDQSLAKITMT